MAERGCPLEAVPLPAEVRESLAELELELSEGDITQKGYEKKRAKLLARCVPLIQGVDPSLQVENSILGPAQASAPAPKQPKPRPSNARDERFRSDVHTEAVQAALAKYKERKMPMPSKRRSVLTHASVEAYTPPENFIFPFPKLVIFLIKELFQMPFIQSSRELKSFSLGEFCKAQNKWTPKGAVSGEYGR